MVELKVKSLDKAPWLGEVPAHWEHRKVSHLGVLGRGRVISNLELIPDGKYPVYSSQTHKNGEMGRINTYDFNGDYVTWTTDGANAGTVFSRKGKFNCTNVCGTIKPKKTISTKFFAYSLSIETKRYVRLDINPKLMNTEMAKIRILVPPKNEQKTIEKYLDKKSIEINSLIADKERLIELLEEKRQAVITETVTKGLDPNVKMKDSGIEWISEIPENWTVTKIRYSGQLQNGISKSGSDFGHGYPFVSYGDVFSNNVLPNEVEGLVNSTKIERKLYSVEKGDVFFTRTSETIEEIAFASTCLSNIDNATFAGFLIRFRPKNNLLESNYIKYYFRSHLRKRYFIKEMNIVTRASLSQGLLKNHPIISPPLKEQKSIGVYLDQKINEIENITKLLSSQISKLKEYRESLIYEAVTGKIDVRDYVTEAEEVY